MIYPFPVHVTSVRNLAIYLLRRIHIIYFPWHDVNGVGRRQRCVAMTSNVGIKTCYRSGDIQNYRWGQSVSPQSKLSQHGWFVR